MAFRFNLRMFGVFILAIALFSCQQEGLPSPPQFEKSAPIGQAYQAIDGKTADSLYDQVCGRSCNDVVGASPKLNILSLDKVTSENQKLNLKLDLDVDAIYETAYLFRGEGDVFEQLDMSSGKLHPDTNPGGDVYYTRPTAGSKLNYNFELNEKILFEGENILLLFYCDQNGDEFDCNNDKWTALSFNVEVDRCGSLLCQNGQECMNNECKQVEFECSGIEPTGDGVSIGFGTYIDRTSTHSDGKSWHYGNKPLEECEWVCEQGFVRDGNTCKPESCPETPPTGSFCGHVFDNKDFTGFKGKIESDKNLVYDWGTDSPLPNVEGDTFSVVWGGYFDFDGFYEFNGKVDDGLRFYIDGNEYFSEAWKDQSFGTLYTKVLELRGRKLVSVEYYENTGGALVDFSWRKLSCGNGVVDSGEECDDGNLADGDGCSSGCANELPDFTFSDVEFNRNSGEVKVKGVTSTRFSYPEVYLACFASYPIQGGTNALTQWWFKTSINDNVQDKFMGNIDQSGLEAVRNNAVRPEITISCHVNKNYDYQMDITESDFSNNVINKEFNVDAICGNGVLELGESCDDGNTVGGDGCSSSCGFENCSNGALNPPDCNGCAEGKSMVNGRCELFCENVPSGSFCGKVFDTKNFGSPKDVIYSTDLSSQRGKQLGHLWAYGSPSTKVNGETFSIRFIGDVQFDGMYKFYANADDGIRFYFGNPATTNINTVIGSNDFYYGIGGLNWDDHSKGPVNHEIELHGEKRVIVEYFENSGQAGLDFGWELNTDCNNGATNYPECNSCPSGKVYHNGGCKDCAPGSKERTFTGTEAEPGRFKVCQTDGTWGAEQSCGYHGPFCNSAVNGRSSDLVKYVKIARSNGNCATTNNYVLDTSCDNYGCQFGTTNCYGSCSSDVHCKEGFACSNGQCLVDSSSLGSSFDNDAEGFTLGGRGGGYHSTVGNPPGSLFLDSCRNEKSWLEKTIDASNVRSIKFDTRANDDGRLKVLVKRPSDSGFTDITGFNDCLSGQTWVSRTVNLAPEFRVANLVLRFEGSECGNVCNGEHRWIDNLEFSSERVDLTVNFDNVILNSNNQIEMTGLTSNLRVENMPLRCVVIKDNINGQQVAERIGSVTTSTDAKNTAVGSALTVSDVGADSKGVYISCTMNSGEVVRQEKDLTVSFLDRRDFP